MKLIAETLQESRAPACALPCCASFPDASLRPLGTADERGGASPFSRHCEVSSASHAARRCRISALRASMAPAPSGIPAVMREISLSNHQAGRRTLMMPAAFSRDFWRGTSVTKTTGALLGKGSPRRFIESRHDSATPEAWHYFREETIGNNERPCRRSLTVIPIVGLSEMSHTGTRRTAPGRAFRYKPK